ncbi:MAG: hypothetical protein KDJ82_14265 [Rhodobacteraceae bacterium]|nr:hypothetical protein [Paracoccaceae bacterium]
MRLALSAIFILAMQFLAGPAGAEAFRLLMVEQPGCAYCERWKAEIGPIYPKTPEGTAAPLEHVQLRGDWPEGITIGSRPVFTPTFLLLKDNVEVGRIEGYPGEDFFWGLLGMALKDAGALLPPT